MYKLGGQEDAKWYEDGDAVEACGGLRTLVTHGIEGSLLLESSFPINDHHFALHTLRVDIVAVADSQPQLPRILSLMHQM